MTVHETTVSFDPPVGPGDFDSRSISSPSDSIPITLFATVLGIDYSASSSVGIYGNLGVEGLLRRTGSLVASVQIFSNEFTNLTGFAQNAIAKFIIDGGTFHLNAGDGSTLTYGIHIDKGLQTVWETSGTLSSPVGGGPVEFTTAGTNVGANLIDDNTLDLPIFFGSADLGKLQPGETLELTYTLLISAFTEGFSEAAYFQFSDPLNVSGFGDYPTVSFQGAVVPLPASLPLFAGGLGLLGLLGWRKRRKAVA